MTTSQKLRLDLPLILADIEELGDRCVDLMGGDLGQLPFAVGLSRSTSWIIKQNLWASLGVVAVLILATIFGLNIGTAILSHEGSTVLVVVNASRLLSYKMAPTASASAAPQLANAE